MLTRFAIVSLLALGLAATASAVPLELPHQGRLFDGTTGDPLDGSFNLTLSLYDQPSGGLVLWSETKSLVFDNGYYSFTLGDTAGNELDAADFDGDTLYVGLTVGVGAELPTRLPLLSVPYAIRAGTAEAIDGGIQWADITDPPAGLDDGDADTLAGLGCSTDEIARHDGSGWVCADDYDHPHDGSDITTGVLDVTRIPVGGSSATVAAGDHVHGTGDITSGVFTAAYLPVGTGATDVAAGNHAHAPAPLAVDSSTTCDATTEGLIRWTGLAFEGCTGAGWVNIGGGKDGSTSGGAGDNCAQIHTDFPLLGSGTYWVDTDGLGGQAAYQVECDMTTDGGGWTRFWWHQNGATMSASDMLGDDLWNCAAGGSACYSRIPVTNPDELLVHHGDGRWGAWDLNHSSNTAGWARGAFVNRTQRAYGAGNGAAWNPSVVGGGTPAGYSCGSGCDYFWYGNFNGKISINLDDDSGWNCSAFTMGYDNGSQLGVDAFDNCTSVPNTVNRTVDMWWR